MKTSSCFVLMMLAAPAMAKPGLPDPGAKVYEEVCQACHMANAMGAVGAGRIAALANNANLASADYPLTVVTGGKGAMPWFRGQLTDTQIADVINYVRSHYDNRYKDRITAVDVAARGVPAPSRGGG
ncbi:MAG: cytochrome c [Sandarakinorhabdus sp.]|nr:cytochrome c [Sandarakinorhabdus sp.]